MTAGAPYRYRETLRFRPADAARDAKTLIAFGRDLYVESLGDESQFRLDYGLDGVKFSNWVAFCARRDPALAALLEENGEPIAMVVLGRGRRDRALGHVHHFYVVPEKRGQGFGGLLDEYARETLARAGCRRARLNVTARNARAIRFYEAQGWREVARGRRSTLRFLEIEL